ncbi:MULTISPECIES: 30S ribosomal protein S14 [Halobacterium]|uniref:Small ribosomal subunit protein uS14 n=5 Tax=Halobacterium salinarum TaxID=2242 RepID=RS14Z_HALSA|nr:MULTISPECIES: 30S ribosomal protein S14 [Halobacterium]Q9HPC0.1 RecName: Full=Small ribosomal subunit protein uS14; AltName: Full=30S ribosomal protein S14 type Z [Halobacterium salinarum NRC-1]AAG19950.1 30S ribosomal protein S14P [Halobacterium salinarum NRC-1]MBB6088956.1 small subunit ribosomal protein S14 [Halobacterium salinarum]MCF2164827.1 30S ribosomal protein S14 [Halobacterium salinarum]MCF2168548.1 30S ribosomal protein S14 [Halobacterium salinarum]MCF2206181.1 30S ribosomal pr
MSETDGEAEETGQTHECRRCGREQGLVGKYDIWLCRQCFREIARSMGFKKYS